MTKFRSHMSVEHIDHMGSDSRPSEAARVSTGADPSKPYKGLTRKLITEEPPHSSPFEHCMLTVKVEVTKRVAWEWMRHRTQSFSEISTRYAHMDPAFYVPPSDRPIMQQGKPMDYTREHADQATHDWVVKRRIELATSGLERYEEELARGVSREVAADNLPHYFYTAFYATGNLRNWLNFLYVRADKHALWEIQDAAMQVEEIIARLWPTTYTAWKNKQGELARLRELYAQSRYGSLEMVP